MSLTTDVIFGGFSWDDHEDAWAYLNAYFEKTQRGCTLKPLELGGYKVADYACGICCNYLNFEELFAVIANAPWERDCLCDDSWVLLHREAGGPDLYLVIGIINSGGKYHETIE